MKERHWTNLATSLRHGQCVLVLGPELPAQPKSAGDNGAAQITHTDALRQQLAGELEKEGLKVSATSLAGVSQQYEDAEDFGSGTLRTETARFYESKTLRPSAAHQAIARLPFPLVISTCQDGALVESLSQAGKSPLSHLYNLRGDRGDNPEVLIPGSADAPVVYHLFGHFEQPQSLVLSENDLLDFLIAVVSDRPPIPNSVRRALQGTDKSFLFLGFGIRNWYLRVLLKALLRHLARDRPPNAVAVEPLLQGIPDYDRQQTILFYQRGTRVEICEDEIQPFLEELQRRLDAAGGVALQRSPLGQRPRVFVSYASEDGGLAARLFSSLRKEGFDPWLDKDALRGGEQWNQAIEDQLRETDYVLVLQTPALAAKYVGYINKEIAIAKDQALRHRGAFLIPLVTAELAADQRIKELGGFQHMPLREQSYDVDLAALASLLRREYQLRRRS